MQLDLARRSCATMGLNKELQGCVELELKYRMVQYMPLTDLRRLPKARQELYHGNPAPEKV